MITTYLKSAILSCLLLPIVANAEIKFTVTNVKNSSHEGHRVKAPFLIDDISNYENVYSYGYPANIIDGLASGASKSVSWHSGYIFRTNISGMYTIYSGWNLDSHIFAQTESFPQIFIPDNSSVDIKINCTEIDGNALKAPETTISITKIKK